MMTGDPEFDLFISACLSSCNLSEIVKEAAKNNELF